MGLHSLLGTGRDPCGHGLTSLRREIDGQRDTAMRDEKTDPSKRLLAIGRAWEGRLDGGEEGVASGDRRIQVLLR